MSDPSTAHEAWTEEQRETTVTVDDHDLSLAYWDSAVADSADGDAEQDGGPPIVCLHGIPTWSFLWRTVAPEVAERTGRRVLSPDLVGYGNSAMHDDFDRSIRAQEQALEDLLRAIDADRCSLVAHDIGGGVALRYAAHEPARVDSLVLSNAVCYDSWPVQFVTDLGLPETVDRDHEPFLATVRAAFEEGVYADEADPAFVDGMVAPWASEIGQRSLARNAVATNTNHTTELDYDAITADLLCLWGSEDSLQPIEYAERLAEDLDGSITELRAYHWVVEDRPTAYADALVRFLTG